MGGRAPRPEFWWVFAFLIGSVVAATYIDMTYFPNEEQQGAVYSALSMVFMSLYIPTLILALSVTIRRLHDLDMSAWYACIFFVPFGLGFVFMGFICARKGTPGPNRFGPSSGYVDIFSEVEEFG